MSKPGQLAPIFLILLLASCARAVSTVTPTPINTSFDAETRQLIANADRVVFVVPFSHWDTDWHATFDGYSKLADGNILSAIKMAQ